MQPYRRPMPPQQPGGYPQNYPPRGYPAPRPMPPQQPRYPQQPYPVPQQPQQYPMQQPPPQQAYPPQQGYPQQPQMQQMPPQGPSKVKSMLYGLIGFIIVVAILFLYSFIQFVVKYVIKK